MTSFYESHDYYKQMLGLQEKLRKSEEERIRLEERFKVLVQESRNRHDACINRLRMRYIEFLEEQRSRDERNHTLLNALDKVDNSLALMTAKTNRLNILRKQYETYLRRTYASRSPPRSTTDTVNQNEEKYSRTNVGAGQINFPPEVLPSTHQNSRLASSRSYTMIQPSQNVYYKQQNRQPGLLNHHLNDCQIALQTHPTIQRDIEPPTFQHLSPVFQQRQLYPDNNPRFLSSNYQLDPNSHIQYAPTDLQTGSNQQIPRLNDSSTQRLGTAQTGMSDFANVAVPPYKSLDASQNRVATRYTDRPIIGDSWRHQTTEALLGNLQSRLRNENEAYAPIILDRSVLATPTLTPSKYLVQSRLNYSPMTGEYCQKPDIPPYPFRNFEGELTNRGDRFTPKLLSNAKANRQGIKQALAEVDEGKATTMVIENELDRYIEKIRKLHQDLDTESLEDLDQNTSGDILNVTLSDDGDHEEDRSRVPKEVQKVLALADDLASRTVDETEAQGKEGKDGNRNRESIRVARRYRPIADGIPVAGSEGRAEDGISGVSLQSELETRGAIKNQRDSGLRDDEAIEQLPETVEDGKVDSDVVEDSQDTETEDTQEEEYEGVYIADESKLDQYAFDYAEELEPWSLDRVARGIREVELTDIEEDSAENDSVDDSELNKGGVEKGDSKESVVTESKVNEAETNGEVNLDNVGDRSKSINTETYGKENVGTEENVEESETKKASQDQEPEEESRNQARDDCMQGTTANTVGEEFEDQKDEPRKGGHIEVKATSEADQVNPDETVTRDEEYADQTYALETNQPAEFAQSAEAEYAENVPPAQEYDYNQTALYRNNEAQGYQDYDNQEYAEGSNEQYEGYAGEQYDQYANVTEGQYEQDPNAQYSEDVNQEYGYTYEQQYDPNQVYETEGNQPYEYTETYDANEEVAQGQDQEQEGQDDKQIVEEAGNKGTEESVEKIETDRSKDDKATSENERKKKDVIESLLDSVTDSTIERNVSNTESDFDFN